MSSRAAGDVYHGALAAIAAKVFEDLAIGASLFQRGDWYEIHEHESLIGFELAHGLISDRYAYNEHCLAQARRGVTIAGHHAGLHDLFVPVGPKGDVRAVMVCGPFASAHLTATEILERWRVLTGRQGHPADPEFSHYLGVALGTLVLDRAAATDFRRFLECLADLIATRGCAPKLWAQVDTLRRRLVSARLAERVWEAARAMVDERTSSTWANPAREKQRKALGLSRVPRHVVVGLFRSESPGADPVADVVRRRALQRACVELGRTAAGALSGPIGDHGVTFLAVGAGSADKARRALVDLVTRTASLARRRFGFAMHFGLGTPGASLPAQYEQALAAAEAALSRNVLLAHAHKTAPVASSLAALRRELVELVEHKPRDVAARFDRFLEVLAVRSAYRMEPARAYLEATFEVITDPLVESGALDARSLDAFRRGVDRAVANAVTTAELFTAYRVLMRDIVQAIEHPIGARHDRSLRRAEEYLRRHYAEPIRLKSVAAVAGFAPNYFSELFHRVHGVTFASYVSGLRVARAKELLETESLTLPRIAQLAGFSRAHYLSRVFRRVTGETPMQYRQRVLHRKGKRVP